MVGTNCNNQQSKLSNTKNYQETKIGKSMFIVIQIFRIPKTVYTTTIVRTEHCSNHFWKTTKDRNH